jgi:hypothetical protein
LLSAQYFIVDFVVLVLLAGLGYRVTRASQMIMRYSWLYQRTSRLTWRQRRAPGAAQ